MLATNIYNRRCAPPRGRPCGRPMLIVPASLSRDIAIEQARVLASSWVVDKGMRQLLASGKTSP